MVRLDTSRLILRNAQTADAGDLYGYFVTDFVQEYNAMQAMSPEEYQQSIDSEIGDENTIYLELKETGKAIGQIHIAPDSLRHRVKSLCLSYWLGEPYAKHGYMKEALEAVIDDMFAHRDIDVVCARAFSTNVGSKKLLTKLGFNHDGTIRRAVVGYKGIVFDDSVFSYLREEWEANKK